MGQLTISGINFEGDFGNRIPAFCPVCGPTEISVPFSGQDSLTLHNTEHTCLKCGNKINVASAHYEFERKVFDTLAEAKLTRQQARRFARKVAETKDQEALDLQSKAINPKLAEATSFAKKESNPKFALNRVAAMALFLASAAGGVVAADDIWDKWSKGELFESHSSENAEHVKAETNNESKPEPNATHPNKKPKQKK